MSSDDDDFVDVVEGSGEKLHAAIDTVVAFKLPPFGHTGQNFGLPRLRRNSGQIVSSDVAQFDKVISELDTEFLAQVADLMESPPAVGKLQMLKDRLISVFTVSEKVELPTVGWGLEGVVRSLFGVEEI